MSDQNDKYTVGWICAIEPEYLAAHLCLDELHPRPKRRSPNDNNMYVLGKINDHNVVIACLPSGSYGTSSATNVATNMLRSFPNVRFGLMVGIGGGAPTPESDIRLGDIVVSSPGDGKGGVFQHDFGRRIQEQDFQETGFLNRPPTILLTGAMDLRVKYKMNSGSLEEAINRLLEKKEELREEIGRPDAKTDVLYQSHFVHPANSQRPCVEACGMDPTNLVPPRPERKRPSSPLVYYGLIASGNELMKDAEHRDELAEKWKVLCFEMEAAGLMNDFPCLVIRGICDYSDTHKNKVWQGYAAIAAAAYAKDLLCVIPPSDVEAVEKISKVLSDLQEATKAHRDIAQKQLEIQQDAIKQKLSDKEKECLQLFRLTKSSEDATYEWFKDRVENRVKGTCMWFLKHDHFKKWLNQESGPLLVTADPGCGKSVLAKYLINHDLPRSATICYFFFKDQDQNTVRQALCALLHQFFSQKPSLIQHAMKQFSKDGSGLINSTRSLWKILGDSIQDPQAGPIVIVLDALDECAESEFNNLIQNVESQLRSNQSSYSKLKYLLTSRPYEQIVSTFQGLLDTFPCIRIPGEEESEIISQEVNYVIKHRVDQLATEKVLSDQVKGHLENQLLKITHRTYLWVYLVFEYLGKEDFKKTPKGVESTIATLPKSINQAYERILNRSKEHGMVRKTLSIILAAGRPLTLSEMNVAINTDNTLQSIHNLDLEKEEYFQSRLRSWCGLFISIHHGKVYFLHQTAREFLLLSTTTSTELQWHHSITIRHAHTVLAELCVHYLNFFNSNASLPADTTLESDHIDRCVFLDYSAKFWALHFREACISNDAAIVPLALKICDPDSKAHSVWSNNDPVARDMTPWFSTSLIVASYFGHSAIATLLLEKGADLESRDKNGQTPLLWAARNGHEMVVKTLLEKYASLESKDKNNQTPLSWAAENGHETVVKILLENSADLESRDKNGQTPLSWAAQNGHEMVLKALLKKGANLESGDKNGETPLSWAARNGHEMVVKILLEKRASLESKDKDGWTPLQWAVERRHKEMVKLLLEKGADPESEDKNDRTPLWWAAEMGHKEIIKLLLKNSANLECRDKNGQTPLSWAAQNGHETVVKTLLKKGADLESRDENGQTPLWWAAGKRHKEIVRLMLEKGADLESRDKNGRTVLLWAVENGYWEVIEMLIGSGTEIKDESSQSPLLLAVENGNEKAVEILLERGVYIGIKDKNGWTPLLRATEDGHRGVVKLLLEVGADPGLRDRNDRTPLSWAAGNGHAAVVKLLLEKSAELDPRDKNDRTPLSWAASNGYKAVVELLLNTSNVDADSKDCYCRTPLWYAAANGHEAVVELLLNTGKVDADSKSTTGRTPLSLAANNGYDAIVNLLLKTGHVDAESKNMNDRTPLSWAAAEGHEAVIQLLLAIKKVNVNSEDTYGRTPLSCAVTEGHEAVVWLLLDKGKAKPNTKDKWGLTPLSRAAAAGHEAIVTLLLDKGRAKSNTKDKWGLTPLSRAAAAGHEAVVRLLLDKGKANRSVKDMWNQMPLSRATAAGHERVSKLLRQNLEQWSLYFITLDIFYCLIIVFIWGGILLHIGSIDQRGR